PGWSWLMSMRTTLPCAWDYSGGVGCEGWGTYRNGRDVLSIGRFDKYYTVNIHCPGVLCRFLALGRGVGDSNARSRRCAALSKSLVSVTVHQRLVHYQNGGDD